MTLTENELLEIIYCMEHTAYSDDEPGYQDWLTAIHKCDFELDKLSK
tara:strand:+ start:10 stop:150 length:141 start_codon:yes stop_codon:yes gene_type:complete